MYFKYLKQTSGTVGLETGFSVGLECFGLPGEIRLSVLQGKDWLPAPGTQEAWLRLAGGRSCLLSYGSSDALLQLHCQNVSLVNPAAGPGRGG